MAKKQSKPEDEPAVEEQDITSRGKTYLTEDERMFGITHNPHRSSDPAFGTESINVNPHLIVGRYAMQPDPNDLRPAPQPVVPPAPAQLPADDENA